MKAPLLLFWFSIPILLTGCSTPQPQSTYTYSPQQQQQDVEKLIEMQQKYRDGAETEKAALRKQVEQLQAENNTLKKRDIQQRDIKKLATYLEINDKIIEHKDEFIKAFQADLEKRQDSVYAAINGDGRLKEFQVEDVSFYKGTLMITMLFLASNQDGSGTLTRGCLNLDPDKDYEVADGGTIGQTLISAQEYAALKGENTHTQVAQEAQKIENHPDAPHKSWVSDETKNKIAQGGIIVGVAGLLKLINDN